MMGNGTRDEGRSIFFNGEPVSYRTTMMESIFVDYDAFFARRNESFGNR